MFDAIWDTFVRNNKFIGEILGLDAPLLLLAGMTCVAQLGVAVMVPLIPLYGVSLGATPLQLGLLTSAFAITSAVGQFGAGFLTDRFGARDFIRGGIAVYAGANVLISTVFDVLSLIAFRSIAGIGSGANLIATRVYLAQASDPKRMAFVNGVLSAAGSAGLVAGPALGGIVAALSDLRVPFLLVGVTSSVAFLGSLLLPRPTESAMSQREESSESSLNRAAIILLMSQLFLLAGYGSFITTYAPFATKALGWSTLEVGIAFSVFGLGSIALGPWLSHLADRYGRRGMAMVSGVPLALFAAVLVLALPRFVVYPVTFLAGAALTAFTAAWFALLSEFSPTARRGKTFGIVNALSQIGVVAGATTASVIWESVNLGAAMLSGSFSVLLASATLILLPRGLKQLAKSRPQQA